MVPLPPRKHLVINSELFIAGPEEVFGCKLSCTAAFVEGTQRAETLVLRTKERRSRNPRPKTQGKNLGADRREDLRS